MLVLAIDTVSCYCSAALLENKTILAQAADNIGKGHAEFLPGQLEKLMKKANKNFTQIDYIGVNIGPGSFTGVRIGVAAARALAVALTKPVIGISNFAALKAEAAIEYSTHTTKRSDFCVALTGPQGQIYSQYFPANGKAFTPQAKPKEILAADLTEKLQQKKNICLIGSAATDLAALLPPAKADYIHVLSKAATASIAIFADLTAENTRQSTKVQPLYMRGPDAKPQTVSLLANSKRQFRIEDLDKNPTDKTAGQPQKLRKNR